MTPEVLHQPLRAGGLSLWELGDLLGIHPHQLHPDELADRPVRVLIDLIPALDAVLGNQRTPHPHAPTTPQPPRASASATPRSCSPRWLPRTRSPSAPTIWPMPSAGPCPASTTPSRIYEQQSAPHRIAT
ncbi:hypothetical protein ABZ801_33905 [Actinomadura sp. NPDC047616]|uniref:hypothetical protein n=1 Tax=Actinomadura sp. NPDC047616 TaxID=3155914 RepID=UPI0033D37FFD